MPENVHGAMEGNRENRAFSPGGCEELAPQRAPLRYRAVHNVRVRIGSENRLYIFTQTQILKVGYGAASNFIAEIQF